MSCFPGISFLQDPPFASAGEWGEPVRHSAGGGPVLLSWEEPLRVVLPLPPVSVVPSQFPGVSSSGEYHGLSETEAQESWEVSCCSPGAGGGRGAEQHGG